MGILYSHSFTTINDLIAKYGAANLFGNYVGAHEGAFRKRMDNCPHCNYHLKHERWLRKHIVVEIVLVVDDSYSLWPNPEELVPVICECPQCGKKNISHYELETLLKLDFVDHNLINKEIESRGIRRR